MRIRMASMAAGELMVNPIDRSVVSQSVRTRYGDKGRGRRRTTTGRRRRGGRLLLIAGI